MIPYGHQSINLEDVEAVIKVLRTDWISQGPKVLEFEKTLADYCGARYAVAVANGTAALHCAYYAAGLSSGDEIIVPAITFVATANAALYLGAKPVFCDIKLETYNIDEDKIEELITSKTKAIVPVHFAGLPCAMDKIQEISKKHQLIVIEDACHALGAEFQGKKIGSISDLSVFSFHPVKPITTGEGGVIVTNNKEYYEKILDFRTHGITKDPDKMTNYEGPWSSEMYTLGYNYRITDLQCALGLSQLKRLDNFQKKREKIAQNYFQQLDNWPGIILPPRLSNVLSSWHLFIIRVKAEDRLEIFKKFKEADIGVQVHYLPVYLHPYYQKLGYKKESCPNAETFYHSAISLPIYPDLTDEGQDFVITKIKELVK